MIQRMIRNGLPFVGGTITGDVTFNGHVGMGAGKVFSFDPGTLALPGLRPSNGGAGTGWSSATADAINQSRLAVSHFTSTSTGLTAAVALACGAGLSVTAGGASFSTLTNYTAALALKQVAVQTSTYAITTSDCVVPMNVAAGGTATLPIPTVATVLYIMNYSGNSLTVARNTKTINGASTDLTVLTNTGVIMQYYPSANDWRVISRSAVV